MRAWSDDINRPLTATMVIAGEHHFGKCLGFRQRFQIFKFGASATIPTRHVTICLAPATSVDRYAGVQLVVPANVADRNAIRPRTRRWFSRHDFHSSNLRTGNRTAGKHAHSKS